MATPAGERRIVAALFVDVAGSTTIAEQLGPERSTRNEARSRQT